MHLPRFHRVHEIERIRNDLERGGFPRLQMFLLVGLTGATGFTASYLFLQAGLTAMWLRYLAAFGVAYLGFLLLLWLWLRTRAEDYADSPDISPSASDTSSSDAFPSAYSGNGGEFSGGGASGSFDGPIPMEADSGPASDALASVSEAEEFAIPLVVIILVGSLLLSSFYMVYSAPMLFAELLVDGVLSARLYRKLRGLETRHWLETALRRTAWPFAFTATIAASAGWGMAQYAPEAHSLGEFMVHAKQHG